MPENTLLRYFFSSGSEVDPEDRFHLNRKTRTRRLKEISDILRKHHFLKGFTPEAFRAMLEDLGPSFVKIGQTLSTRSEILPKAYCDELAKLQMECDPLPFEAILEALDDIYGDAQGDVFDAIDPTPLGSASLAQVHKARLVTGEIVAVKIQRPGVKTTMAQDIDIMRMVARYAARFMKDEQMLDLRDVVEELWATFLEETDFQREAANLEEFARLNKGVAFIDCPKVHTELCGEYVLVMEYIDGIPILATDRLRKAGYDLEEIGEKILDNYASQILDHGFFHADPHPGNLLVRSGKIVYIDLGIMGRLSPRDRAGFGNIIQAVGMESSSELKDALLCHREGQFGYRPYALFGRPRPAIERLRLVRCGRYRHRGVLERHPHAHAVVQGDAAVFHHQRVARHRHAGGYHRAVHPEPERRVHHQRPYPALEEPGRRACAGQAVHRIEHAVAVVDGAASAGRAGARVLRLSRGCRAVGMGGLRHQQAQAVAPGSFSFPSSNVPQPIIAENSN